MKEVVVCLLLASVDFFQVSEGRPSFLPDIPSKINNDKPQISPKIKLNDKKVFRNNTSQDSKKDLKADEQTPFSEGRPSFLPDIPLKINKTHNSPDSIKADVEKKKGLSGIQNSRKDLKAEENIQIIPVLPLSETVNSLPISELKEKGPLQGLNFPLFNPGIITGPDETRTSPLKMAVPSDSQLVPTPILNPSSSEKDFFNEPSKVILPKFTSEDVIRPSESEPRNVQEKPKELVESYAPRKHAKHWLKKNSKLTFNEPVIDCLRSDIFKQISVKIYEQQELIAEPRLLIKPIYNVLPSLETEVTYREEKRKVIMMVPKEKLDERIVQSVIEVEDLVIDEVSGEKKKVIRLVPMTSTVIVKCVELVPEEFETTVKIPVFAQKNSSITIQTFTGVMGTVPVRVTTMDMMKKTTEGAILTPNPKLDNP